MNWRWKIAQAAEIRWWERYLQKKPVAEYQNWKREYWQKLLDKIDVAPKAGQHILDAGCGPAGVFMALPNNPVDAVDPLLDQYAEKLSHFSKENYSNVSFYNSPLEQFAPAQPYDIVFCLNAINHVADLDLCFDNLLQATAPGGTLVVSIDAHNYSFFKYIFKTIPGDILHPHQYDLKEYQSMLTTRNCSIEKTTLMDKGFFFNYFVLVAKKNI